VSVAEVEPRPLLWFTLPMSYYKGNSDNRADRAQKGITTMTLALYVESVAPDLDGLPATYQTVLFPSTDNTIGIYHRHSNGSKGRGQVWSPITVDTMVLPASPIIKEPVAVVLSDRDLQMATLGSITNIAVKAMYAYESANLITATVPHNWSVTMLRDRLLEQDPTLSDFITDKRRTSPVVFTQTQNLVENVVEQTEPIKPIELVKEETEVATDKTIDDMALAMITVPDSKWASEYVHRKINGVSDFDIFDKALETGTNVLIEGGAGSGKTISVQAYASARGMRYFNVSNSNGIEPSQLFGGWIPREDGQGYRWQDGAVTMLVRHGGVLLLNEVNFLPTRVSTVLFSLLDYRREIQLLEHGGETIKAHPNLLIVADMNAGYKGTQELNQAFNDRFGIKLEFPYDRTIENKVVNNKSLLTLADQLREQYEKEELTSPISTRSLVDFMKNARTFGIDFAITSFVNAFHKEERGGVRLACETHKELIATDMGVKIISHPDNEQYRTEVLA